MSDILERVDQKTQLAGRNRLELLLFHLGNPQHFAINVFKVQEVITCPPLTALPNSHPVIRGVATVRGRTLPVIDLAMAVGMPALPKTGNYSVIVTEYNCSVQGFLVCGMDRIVNMNWQEILPPPAGLSRAYLTAVSRVDDRLIQIIDVEKVLSEVMPTHSEISEQVLEGLPEATDPADNKRQHILVADDSRVARKQITRTLDTLGLDYTAVNDGRAALDQLLEWEADDHFASRNLLMVISDIEMPNMDGYSLTRHIREHEHLKDLHVILHTSMSGIFNEAMVKSVGADRFLPKFSADSLAEAVLNVSTDSRNAA